MILNLDSGFATTVDESSAFLLQITDESGFITQIAEESGFVMQLNLVTEIELEESQL